MSNKLTIGEENTKKNIESLDFKKVSKSFKALTWKRTFINLTLKLSLVRMLSSKYRMSTDTEPEINTECQLILNLK